MRFKKALSLILAICMIISLLPQIAATEGTQEKSGITVKYDFAAQFPGWKDTTPFASFTYDTSHNLWDFYATTSVRDNGSGTPLRYRDTYVDMYYDIWFAVKINIPKSGEYTPYQDYAVCPSTSKGAFLDAYIIPVGNTDLTKDEITALLDNSSQYCIGSINCQGTGSAWPTNPTQYEFKSKYFDAGEYYLVYSGTYENAWEGTTPMVAFGNLILNGGDGAAVMKLESGMGANPSLYSGTSITAKTMAYMSDGTYSVLDNSLITYTSSNSEIIRVDDGGKLVAVAENGSAVITAEYNGMTVESNVTVLTGSPSGITVKYDFAKAVDFYGNKATSPTFKDLINYEKTNNLFDYYSNNGNDDLVWGTPIKGFDWGLSMYIDTWFAVKMNIPKSGIYTPYQDYVKNKEYDGDLETHIIPAGDTDLSDAEIATFVSNKTYLVGSISCQTNNPTGDKDKPYTTQYPAKHFDKGEYYLVFNGVKTAESTTGATPTVGISNLVLNGGDGATTLEATVSADKVQIMENDTANASVSLLLSNGETVKATGGVSYASTDTEVVEIDANGKMTAKKAGKATIRMSYTDEWISDSDEMEITVIEFAAANTSIIYDLAAQMPGYRGETPFADYTYESSGDTWAYYSNNTGRTNGYGTPMRYRDWGCDMNSPGLWFAIKIKVPQAGVYAPKQYYGLTNSTGGILNTYAIPVGEKELTDEEITALVEGSDAYLLGSVSCQNANAGDYTLNSLPAVYPARYFEKQEYYIVFYSKTAFVGFSNLELDGYDGLKSLEVDVQENIDVGKSYPISIAGKMLDMSTVPKEDMQISITTANPAILSYSDGKITGVSEGNTMLTVTAMYDGELFQKSLVINITDNTGVDYVGVNAPEYVFVRDSETLGFTAYMNSKNAMDIPGAGFSIVSCEPEGAATLSDGILSANAVGKVVIKATGAFKGENYEAECEIELRAGATKNGRTIYTDERLSNAVENASKYDWAKSEVKAAIEAADDELSKINAYYELFVGEGLPRARLAVGINNGNLDVCRYCGEATTVGGWNVDFVNRPWKVQCSQCKRLFPSNSFEDFVKLGIDEKGNFNRAQALDKHREMLLANEVVLPDGEISDARKEEIAKGAIMTREEQDYYGYGIKGGYLYNELYSEVGTASTVNCGKGFYEGERVETWGVDDGWGYLTGKIDERDLSTPDDDVIDRHCYVALFNYKVWTTLSGIPQKLGYAYMYTGDKKYARPAAVLLDKIADIYPSFDTYYFAHRFQVVDGGSRRGKVVGQLDDCVYASGLADACDMLFPLLYDNDEQTVNMIAEKAAERGNENTKTTGMKIWENWEKNILLEIFREEQSSSIGGNEGRYQEALARTAVSLDKEPESDQMFEWIFQSGGLTGSGEARRRTGGNIYPLLIGEVDRDGMGNESGANYNTMWSDNFLAVANLSALYGKDEYDLYKNPKFAKLIVGIADMTLVDAFTVQIGDSSRTARVTLNGQDSTYMTAFPQLKDTVYGPQLADFIFKRYKGEIDDLHYDLYTANPEKFGEDIRKIVETSGYTVDSKLMAGYGLAVLRDGKDYTKTNGKNSLRDFWMYFGGAKGHKHADSLNLGFEVFGLNFAPDNGYPADPTVNADRMQWTNATLAHNTVTVNGKNSKLFIIGSEGLQYPGQVHHFDSSEKVKLMDIAQPEAYDATSEYRRTVVMIEADDDVSYGIDFFRVTGGNEHTFSFHAQSGKDITPISGLGELVPQVDENGKYIGSLVGMGEDGKGAPYTDPTTGETKYFIGPGADPGDPYGNWFDTDLAFPTGKTWLHSVRRSKPTSNQFAVDFEVVDYRKAIKDNKDLHLKLTMLNDFELSEVAFAKGPVPRKDGNAMIPDLEYMVATRKGENLDSLFTTVYEPYKKNDYIESIEPITPEIISGKLGASDVVKAVKVTHKEGNRTDYIIYSTNESVTYRLEDDDDMIFNGFVGVWTKNADDDKVIYSYRHGGDISITGKIAGFQKELSSENYIDIKPASEVSPTALAGKTLIVSHDGIGNAAYEILSASENDDGTIKLDIGTVTTVRNYVNKNDFSKGYVYNISADQNFVIPMTEEENPVPVFAEVADGTTSAGSTYKVVVSATGNDGAGVTITGRDMPRGASFDSNTNTFSWKPDSSQVGDNHVSLTATDEFGRESTVHFTVTVYGATTGNKNEVTETPSDTGTSGGGGGGGGGAAPETPSV
ncbi:MAG: heparinase II/III family protein, partial [Oscillospiraceae bacterium]|nr:heparinase II/III family protein [Oscillospiraceae bacterium]